MQVDKPGARINPMLFGLMTEEINFSYDGGLYGELIQNRIFRNTRGARGPAPELADAKPIEGVPHWYVVTSADAWAPPSPDANDPVNTTALTTSLKLTISTVPAGGRVGVANTGYWGIPAKPNTHLSVLLLRQGLRRLHRPADRRHRIQRRQNHSRLRHGPCRHRQVATLHRSR